jgi:hypothetical protein
VGRTGDDFSGGIGRRRSPDRFDVGKPFVGSVYPTKGKGVGVQGEAVYLDLLAKWDKDGQWQSWRKGMTLAQNFFIGAAERFTAVVVEHRDSFALTPTWRSSTLLLAVFTSVQSPDGRWTVAIQPRGTEVTTQPVGSNQREVWYQDPAAPEDPPLRLLELNFKAATQVSSLRAPLQLNRMLIGEVVEDSALKNGSIEDDLTAGIGLLCMAVYESEGLAYFDATRFWRRDRTVDGRLVTREIKVSAQEAIPTFRSDHCLTQATTISCNCPSHLGLEFVRFRAGQSLGTQALFPQRSPSGLENPKRGEGEGVPEGLRRRFQPLRWDRIPGWECKHCHAVRWALGAPMEEPTDMQSLASDYWQDMKVMSQVEQMDSPMRDPRFLDDLQRSLLNEQAFSMLDVSLLAACVGDCVGIAPQRVDLASVQLKQTTGPVPLNDLNVLRQNEQHPTSDPLEDHDAVFGDWWVGRGTATAVFGFDGPAKPRSNRAIEPLPPGTVTLPTVIP